MPPVEPPASSSPTPPSLAQPPTPPLTDHLAALAQAENAALQERRALLGASSAESMARVQSLPRVGLALSGGGVRSATFALGLMRGLAQSGRPAGGAQAAPSLPEPTVDLLTGLPTVSATTTDPGPLERVDYLSTVSGGGYVGAMYGRLMQRVGMARAQELMASSGSVVLEWLRRNGRYLTPSGSRDTGIAVVTYLRAWLAIHVEFMFACMLLGLLVIAPHLWQHSYQLLDPLGWSRWFSPWWTLAAWVWVLLSPGLIVGYWTARDAPERSDALRRILRPLKSGFLLLVLAVVAWILWGTLGEGDGLDPVRHGMNWSLVACCGLTSVVAGQLGVMLWMGVTRESYALNVARVRNGLTRALRWVMLAALALVGLGALDLLSWWILEEFLTDNNVWLWRGVGVGSIGLVLLRALMQPLQQIAADTTRRAVEWLPRLLNIGSIIGLLALVTAWTVVLQWFVFAPDPFVGLRDVPAWMRASLLALAWAGWMLTTGGNAQMANTSSLHSFYRARLTRAYLAVGNPQRSIDPEHPRKTDVTTVVEGDDTRLAHYRPEAAGGPIHLINTCLNQTRDDQSGLYNADRKGTAVTATWRGFEIGPREFMALADDYDAGTLGRWVAVSGAAASPGAGSYTARGLALLVYFLGVRLGYWMRAPRERAALRWLSHLAWRCWPKPLMLSSEASATFFGLDRPWWYLSDGGHFENTGVYPLLKRELDFIILSDASCDARYEFADLENLVRKARIDFGAEIDFYNQHEAARLFATESPDLTVLSPEDMADNHSCRGVMIARIRYRERPGPMGADGRPGPAYRPEGTLLVVKPNLHDALDVDLLAYAQKHQSFPHESTGDQSFDEAQWESYHRLGEDFGRVLSNDWLSRLPGWLAPAQHDMHAVARLSGLKTLEAPRTEPFWRRGARATAIGTTLGLGASGTLLLSLWQVQDQVQRSQTDEQNEARKLFTDFSLRLQELDGACPKIPEHTVTTAATLFTLRGGSSLSALEREGLDRMADRVADECKKAARDDAVCAAGHQRMQRDLCTVVGKKNIKSSTSFSYWNPSATRLEQARAGAKVWQSVAAYVPIPLAWTEAPGVQVAGLPGGMGGGAGSVGGVAGASAGAQAPSKMGQAVATGGSALGVGSGVAAPPAAGAGRGIAELCARAGGAYTTVYLQVYDEASRQAATALREAYLKQAGNVLQVAPIENVVRSAELRQQRRAVPWPKATFVVHDPGSTACAGALAKLVGPPWAQQSGGEADPPWIRGLPSRLQANPGVIELWLPPVASYAQKAAYMGPSPSQDR
ncbi:hypothetical protein [Variovorax sp. HJSM1_2]|uniref:hypothetical protein n=1 Tax=Variovorax sp. HJSM1_2 TaxID=3366263 RepID=UPI003BE8C5B6